MIDETLLLEIIDQQGWSFPLQSPLILDSKNVDDWGRFQLYLRLCTYINQNGVCVCGKELDNNSELHHALISRKDALNLSEPNIVHSSYNVVLLHHNCHQKIKRVLCIAFLLQIFKFSDIQKWYQDVKSQMKGEFRSVEGLLDDKFLPGQRTG